jgi:TolB protein
MRCIGPETSGWTAAAAIFFAMVMASLVGAGPVAAQESGGDDSSSTANQTTAEGSQSSRQSSSGGESETDSDSGADESDGSAGSGKGIDIDVSVGARRVLRPMAVPDTREPGGTTDGLAEQVQETLRRDLRLSGFFKVLPPDSYFFDTSDEGMSALEIQFENWFNIGAQGLIKSEVRTEDDGTVKLDLRLYKVETEKRVELDWDGGAVDEDDVESKVHEFVNAVLEHYTGTRGVFGSKITFVKRNDQGLKQIFVSRMDGSKRTQLTDNGSINMLPSWGKDAVYYTSYRHQNPDLWKYEDGNHTKVSSRKGQNSGASYCGGNLALTLSMGGENADIYLIDPETGNTKKRLTDNWAIDTAPTWSPDCSKIAFVSGRSGSPQIYVMNADGSDKRRLTFKGSYNTSPEWSPKGDEIAFTARDKYNHFDIFLVDLDGNLTRLTQDQGNNEEPSFSPDGRYVVFTSDRGADGKRLWLMTADGQIQKPLTPDETGFAAPNWQK